MTVSRRYLWALFVPLVLQASACSDEPADPADAGPPGSVDASPSPTPDAGSDPRALSAQGLYVDTAAKTVVPGALAYAPLYPLWSDGAEKQRWLVLPEGARIDTSDPDHWRFPVGTKLFKEFRDPASGKRLETRLLRVDGPDRVFLIAYVWNDDESDAFESRGGAEDVGGTRHDVPSQTRCRTCHEGEPGRVLGFSAVQLSGEAVPNLDSVAPLLSHPLPAGTRLRAPGGPATSAALGYLHANCGACHNPLGSAARDTCLVGDDGSRSKCLVLRLSAAECAAGHDPSATELWRSTVGEPTHGTFQAGFPRVSAGDPARSAVVYRAGQRGSAAQMPPPFASEAVDDDGLALVTGWITGLSRP